MYVLMKILFMTNYSNVFDFLSLEKSIYLMFNKMEKDQFIISFS